MNEGLGRIAERGDKLHRLPRMPWLDGRSKPKLEPPRRCLCTPPLPRLAGRDAAETAAGPTNRKNGGAPATDVVDREALPGDKLFAEQSSERTALAKRLLNRAGGCISCQGCLGLTAEASQSWSHRGSAFERRSCLVSQGAPRLKRRRARGTGRTAMRRQQTWLTAKRCQETTCLPCSRGG